MQRPAYGASTFVIVSRRPVPRPVGRSTERSRSRPWGEATEQALYGPGGFFHRPEGPAGHFRTSVHASPLFARAVLTLLEHVDDALGHPDRVDLVDVGAGRGELLRQVAGFLADSRPDHEPLAGGPALVGRLHLHAVERAERPAGIPAEVTWGADLPEQVVGLVVANEWLDNVPIDVVEASPDGLRQVLVDLSTGEEAPGGAIGLRDASWLNRWWPLAGASSGERAEVGYPRDHAWAAVVRSVRRGVVVAVDYGHLKGERMAGDYESGTLTGYRAGRAVPPVPDGSCDLTSHVAVDACAASGERAGASSTRLLHQREALIALGIEGVRPSAERASTDPVAYAQGLAAASEAAELLDPHGLGGFWWLVQGVRMHVPGGLGR